jgi:transaldolase
VKERYFHRVTGQSPTKFWINNPTRTQCDWAIAEGALGCTNNPSYTQKMLDHPDEGDYAAEILDEVLREFSDDNETIQVFQRRLVKPIADKFMPMFRRTSGEHGYVSIQGDPIREDDPNVVITDARENRKLSPNICCKIPTTTSGLKAMEVLVAENVSLNATEIFGISQMISICEMYEKVSSQSGRSPKLYISHIAGIYDDFLRNYVEQNQVDISPDVLHQAGLAVARKAYQIMKERGYRATFIGGGARGLHHFMEMVGADACITINWEGAADKLIETDPPVVYRFFNPVPQKVIDELLEKLPDFRRGYLEDGLETEEYEDFGPVQLFRSSFTKSWKRVLDQIKDRRAKLGRL